ncbi:MAG: hypothetical protein JRI71_05365 [Deltaproteobacteria bacterium]|nr:hypothetical protein [Deltaproteobacteria bacterium]
MNHSRWIIVIVCVCVLAALVASGSPAWAFGTELSRASMAGIRGVTVRVEGSLEKDLEQQGLTKDTLRGDVESQLQAAGITLLSDLVFLETKERPMLIITINTLKHGQGYIFSVIAQLYQHVYLIKKGQDTTYPATSWSSAGAIGILYNPEDLRSLVKEEVDAFIKAYLSANP